MSDLPQGLLLLLPLCVAAGIDLYLTLTLLGLALWHGAMVTELVLPGAFGGGLALGCTTLLFLIEALAQRRSLSALVWHNIQLLNRPLAGCLMGVLMARGEDPVVVLAVAGLGGVVAAFAHVITWGQGLLLRLLPGAPRVRSFDLAGDMVVLGLVILAVYSREAAFATSVLGLVLSLILGHHLHAAVRFGFVLLRGLAWGILSSPGWANRDELPPWVRAATAPQALEEIRGLRAGRTELARRRRFEEGWLVERGNERFFTFRRHRRPIVVPLPGAMWGPANESSIARTHIIRSSEETPAALFLQRNGPALKSHKLR